MSDARLPETFVPGDQPNENWKQWKQDFLIYLTAAEKLQKPEAVKIALLANAAGRESCKVFKTFPDIGLAQAILAEVLAAFDNYYAPFVNVELERHTLMNRKKLETETVDQFVTDIKTLAEGCEYGDVKDSMIKTHLIHGINNQQLQLALLNKRGATLDEIINICRNHEISNAHAKAMNEQKHVDVVKGKQKPTTKSHYKSSKHSQNHSSSNSGYQNQEDERSLHNNSASQGNRFTVKLCLRCGSKHKSGECPAFGLKCSRCNRLNHFAKVCKAKWVNEVHAFECDEDNSSTSEDDNYFYIHTIYCSEVRSLESEWCENVQIGESKVKVKLDTGANVNILSKSIYESLKVKSPILESKHSIKSYSGHCLNVIGISKFIVKTKKNESAELDFYIVDNSSTPILGLQGCQKLNLIFRCADSLTESLEDLIKEYKNVFDNSKLGKLPYEYDIKLAQNAKPKVFAPKIIPHVLLDSVKSELNRLESWQHLAIDFMQAKDKDFVLLVDDYPKVVEVKELTSKNAQAIIKFLQEVFRTRGIPGIITSDCGPPFDSVEYKGFLCSLGIEVNHSSPTYPQSNVFVERTIQTIKSIMLKCMCSKTDYNLAILEYNSTSKSYLPASSVCLMGRLLKTTLPVHKVHLEPKFDTTQISETLLKNQLEQKKTYDKNKKVLSDLNVSDEVFIQLGPQQCVPAVVEKANNQIRSYLVKTTDGRRFRRNRYHLRSKRIPKLKVRFKPQIVPQGNIVNLDNGADNANINAENIRVQENPGPANNVNAGNMNFNRPNRKKRPPGWHRWYQRH